MNSVTERSSGQLHPTCTNTLVWQSNQGVLDGTCWQRLPLQELKYCEPVFELAYRLLPFTMLKCNGPDRNKPGPI